MKKSMLVIGIGQLGTHLAVKLEEMGNDVMAVDKDELIINAIADRVTESMVGDCTNVSVVDSLGVENFDACFITIGNDFQASLVTAYLLKRAGAKIIVAKARRDIQAELLKNIGVSEVIFPEKEMAEKLAVRHNVENVFEFIPLPDDYAICEISVPGSWIGKTIVEINVRAKYGMGIVAIVKDKIMQPAPSASYEFCTGDHMMVIGKSADVFKLSAGK